MGRKYWTREEEQFIRDNIGNMTITGFSLYFNLEKVKIVDKIHKMGLNSSKARNVWWNDTEDRILKAIYEYAPKHRIANFLPDRTWPSIVQRATKTLGLNRVSQDLLDIEYDYFSSWNPKSAYIFGFILADGHLIHTDVNALQFELKKEDTDILYKIKEALDFEGTVKVNRTARLQINNAKILKDLIDKGMPEHDKSHTAKFPPSLPEEYYRDFIRGVIDGDGWIYIESDGRLNLGLCGNLDLIQPIKELFPVDCSKNSIRKDKGYCWRFNIRGKKALTICDWLYKDAQIFLDRKYNNYINYKNQFSVS